MARETDHEPDLAAIREAAARIAPWIHRTPVATCRSLDELVGARLFFKCENMQKAGAFKMRGASNAVFSLDGEEAARGVATHSSGNHAQALALAARNRGVAAHIVMPSGSPAVKRTAVEGYGGRIALCEPTLLLGLLALARKTGQLSLAGILGTASPLAPEVLLVAAALTVVLLCETGRVPVDDPATHLELTMIHEVMILDHGGPDLALMQYAAALRLWLWSALVVGLLAPSAHGWPWRAALDAVAGILVVAVAIGLVESGMARARLVRAPHLLTAAGALAALAFILVLR